MKNALFYYYHLYPEFIIKKQGKCIFNLEDLSYQLTPVTRGEEELEEIVSLNAFLSEEKYPKIVLNIFGQPLSFIENHNYILISSPISWHSKNRTLANRLSFYRSKPVSSFKSFKLVLSMDKKN